MFYGPKTVKWEIGLGSESNDTAAKFSSWQLSQALSGMFCLPHRA